MRYAYINGKIFTSNDEQLYADTFIVEDGKIAEIGIEEELNLTDCQIIDLKNKRVLPGFIDAHMHALMLADYSKKISCLPPAVNSIEELIQAIKGVRQKQEPGQWITGWGYDEGKLSEHRSPNRYDLDKGAADVPVSLIRTCGHIRCVNSKALELAGIDRNTPDPQGGHIERDQNGEPTGVLQENARNLITSIMPKPTVKEQIDNLVELGELLLSQGIVACTDMGSLDDIDVYQYYEEAAAKGMKQEVAIYLFWDFYEDGKKGDIPKEQFDRDNQVRIAGVKIIGDGSVSGKTAWVEEPFLGSGDEYGMPVCSEELLESAIKACKKYRCQLSAHAMGKRTIRWLVDRAYEEENWMDDEVPYVRFEHVTEPSADAINKVIEKNMAFVTQPIFLYAEIESYLHNFGAERTKTTYPIRALLDQGVRIAISTDAPATSWAIPSDPFPNLKAAVTRKAYDGTDCGQDQAIDIETAIKLYTREAAWAAGFKHLGQLKPGYKANFIVLSDDILEIAIDDMDKICVEQTYIRGEKVYQR